MMRIRVSFLFLCAVAVVAWAQQKVDTLNLPYDSLMDYRVSVDGYIDHEDNEYPASFRDPVTGITVSWGHDDSLLYVGLEAKGKGWMAIGFGSPVMKGSNMVIGLCSEDSVAAFNHVGGERGHRAFPGNISLIEDWEIDYDDETNTMTMEFVYPLRWQKLPGTAVKSLDPGKVYDLILARNPRTISLGAKHPQKSRRVFRIVPAVVRDSTSAPSKGN